MESSQRKSLDKGNKALLNIKKIHVKRIHVKRIVINYRNIVGMNKKLNFVDSIICN